MIDSIYKAIEEDRIEVVNRLLDEEINDILDGGWNPLHEACKAGNFRVVELILSYIQKSGNVIFDINSEYESVESYSDNRGTALTEALLNGHKDIAKLLIVKGANVNATYYNQDSNCPEWFFCEYDLVTANGVAWWLSDEELFNLCLSHGLEIDASGHQENTALIYAVSSSKIKRVLQLLENGANTNLYCQHDDMGEIPLIVHAALIHCKQKTESSFEIVRSLLKYGAPLSAQCRDCDNETVVDIVMGQGTEDLIELFGLTNLAEKITTQNSMIEFMDIDNTYGTENIEENAPLSNPYFKISPESRMLNLDLLVAREPADPDRVVRAKILMEQASTGVGEKRNPIGIVPLDNGKFRVLDGNTTLQALRDLGETVAIVEVMQAITDSLIPSSSRP